LERKGFNHPDRPAIQNVIVGTLLLLSDVVVVVVVARLLFYTCMAS